jgi:hypothetical protein
MVYLRASQVGQDALGLRVEVDPGVVEVGAPET